jgi:hypothetical protein
MTGCSLFHPARESPEVVNGFKLKFINNLSVTRRIENGKN